MPAPARVARRGPRYLIVNGDEMEPGAFKDRFLLEALPHQVIEGAIIAAHAMHATEAIVLIRDAIAPASPRWSAPSPRPRQPGCWAATSSARAST